MTALAGQTSPAGQVVSEPGDSRFRSLLDLNLQSAAVLLGALLALLAGACFAWNVPLTIAASVLVATSIWAAGSVARAIGFFLGVLGLVSAFLLALALLVPAVAPSTVTAWNAIFVCWLGITTAALLATRRWSPADASFNPGEIVGLLFSTAGLIALLVKLDFKSNLLLYLLSSEDNAAWVKTTNQVFSSDFAADAISGGLGPLIPAVLGILHALQGANAPIGNATVEAYALAIVLVPLVAGCLVGAPAGTEGDANWVRWAKATTFTLIVLLWAFLVPAKLATEYGHLSAVIAFMAILATVGFLVSAKLNAVGIAVGLSLMLVVAEAWFPVAPLAGLGILVLLGLLFRQIGRRGRALVAATGILAGVVLLVVLERSGIPVLSDPGRVSSSVKDLYAARGGTASVEDQFLVIVLVAVIGLGAVAAGLGARGRALSASSVVLVIYLGIVAATAAALGVAVDSYGLTKLTFVCGLALAVVVVASSPQVFRERQGLIAVAAALFLGSFIYGGGREFFARAWPGDGAKPSWVTPLDAAIEGMKGRAPRPIACVSPTPLEAYLCTRWAGAVGPAGESTFQLYREEFLITDGALPANYFVGLAKDGTLDESDILVLGKPTRNMQWFKTLEESGARLYDVRGGNYRR